MNAHTPNTDQYKLDPCDQAIVDLLWDYLKRDPEYKDRRQTAYGSKTKYGLARSIEAIINEHIG